ncbi:DUF6088 family protein [Nostoc sp.]
MKPTKSSVAEKIRNKIEESEEGYWMYADFADYTATAVSKTLSRLEKDGTLMRVSKGLYYRPRMTRFGRSHPCQEEIQKLAIKHHRIENLHPAGISAANLLGFTTQNSVQGEFATSANSAPRTIVGSRAQIHTRRPSTWNDLTDTETSLLDFLRCKGKLSELSPAETKRKLLNYFREGDHFERLVNVADKEPPRVRAMLGAIGQELGKSRAMLMKIKKGLNPVSHFDFGNLSNLRYAKEWQAK